MDPGHPRTAHAHCERVRAIRYQREGRLRRPGQSTPYVRRWREQHPDREEELREQERARVRGLWPELPEAEQRAILSRAHAADLRDRDLTAELAENGGAAWWPDDDRYLIDHWHEPARDVGIALGRTAWAIRTRRVALRKLHPELGRARPPRNTWQPLKGGSPG